MMPSDLRPVPGEPQPEDLARPAEPELLAFGPRPPSRRSRRALLIALLAATMAVTGLGLWQIVLRPLPDFSSSDLEDVYSGMVRGDGTNDAYKLLPEQVREPPVPIAPASCAPLFDATVANRFPANALDGESTYWLNAGNASISLLTYRYTDSAAARREFRAVTKALTDCVDTSLTLGKMRDARVEAQPGMPTRKVQGYASYLVTAPSTDGRYSIDVFRLNNTLTWQFRYHYGRPSDYSPLGAQQLMESMIVQMRSIQEAHR